MEAYSNYGDCAHTLAIAQRYGCAFSFSIMKMGLFLAFGPLGILATVSTQSDHVPMQLASY